MKALVFLVAAACFVGASFVAVGQVAALIVAGMLLLFMASQLAESLKFGKKADKPKKAVKKAAKKPAKKVEKPKE